MKPKLLYILSVLLCMVSCSGDEVQPQKSSIPLSSQIIGSWYCISTDANGNKNFEELTFSKGNTFSSMLKTYVQGYAVTYPSGDYSVNDKEGFLHYEYDEFGNTIKQDAKIVINDLEMTYICKYGCFIYSRVVGQYSMSINEESYLDVLSFISSYLSENPTILSYQIIDENLVSINAEGKLTPKLSGTTYLKVDTTAGTVAIKLSIIDSDNLWNDYTSIMGKTLDDAMTLLGSLYYYKDESQMNFFIDNYYVNELIVGVDYKNTINEVDLLLKEGVRDDEILSFLQRKYVFLQSNSNKYIYVNSDTLEAATLQIQYDKNRKNIQYYLYANLWDDYCDAFGLSLIQLKEMYGIPEVEINNLLSYTVQKPFYSEIIFHVLNGDSTINGYSLILNDNVSKDFVLDYLKRNYQLISGNYCKNVLIRGEVCFISATYHEEEHEFVVYLN